MKIINLIISLFNTKVFNILAGFICSLGGATVLCIVLEVNDIFVGILGLIIGIFGVITGLYMICKILVSGS